MSLRENRNRRVCGPTSSLSLMLLAHSIRKSLRFFESQPLGSGTAAHLTMILSTCRLRYRYIFERASNGRFKSYGGPSVGSFLDDGSISTNLNAAKNWFNRIKNIIVGDESQSPRDPYAARPSYPPQTPNEYPPINPNWNQVPFMSFHFYYYRNLNTLL